jgi:hypothetical protein
MKPLSRKGLFHESLSEPPVFAVNLVLEPLA